MRGLLPSAVLLLAMGAQAQEFRLPFKGRWFVTQGGDTPNVNNHMNVRAQWFGMDFMKVGGEGNRSLFEGDGNQLARYYSWGEAVLSPVSGRVEAVVDGFPDNPLGKKDLQNPAGNHVVISIGAKYVFIAHFQNGSVRVKAGQKIEAGQELGKCGNSGNSDAPHVHMHVQDTPIVNQGQGQNVVFTAINAELSGKIFEKVDWPLIRGLFVWNEQPGR